MPGGAISGVYAYALPEVDPLLVGNKKVSRKGFGFDDYDVVEKNDDPAKRKLEIELNFGGVSSGIKSVGPLNGTLEVCLGGTEYEIVIADPLKHPRGPFDHPALKKMGIQVEFVRHGNVNSSAFLFNFKKKEINRFAGLEVVKKDGTLILQGYGGGSSGENEGRSISVEHEELKGNVLRLRLRDGARKAKIPFEIETIFVR